jgi:mobilization protein NikA
VKRLKPSKTELIMVRLTRSDRTAIEKAAVRSGMNLSEYMRACTLTMMLTELDPHAFRCLGQGISASISEMIATRGKKLATS